MLIQHNGELLDVDLLYASMPSEYKAVVDAERADNITLRFKLRESLREIERLTISANPNLK